jgi:hypothetical protein
MFSDSSALFFFHSKQRRCSENQTSCNHPRNRTFLITTYRVFLLTYKSSCLLFYNNTFMEILKPLLTYRGFKKWFLNQGFKISHGLKKHFVCQIVSPNLCKKNYWFFDNLHLNIQETIFIHFWFCQIINTQAFLFNLFFCLSLFLCFFIVLSLFRVFSLNILFSLSISCFLSQFLVFSLYFLFSLSIFCFLSLFQVFSLYFLFSLSISCFLSSCLLFSHYIKLNH